ncbi:MAG: Cardiolipin synthase A [Chlamydiia bacterium]|nr:Cardiolipin synthase A [Chlamydiia bacterium]MCH9615143.1 Cardiolipin synthase A [Chlamydiia bacterium]MCH9628535.1 Cardiolipin synthase A [Chlamydiia bacterium]
MVKKSSLLFALILLVSLWVELPKNEGDILIYSTGNRIDLKYVLTRALKSAKRSIHVESYGLGDPKIRKLLVQAAQKGLLVSARFDKRTAKPLPHPVQNFPIKRSGLMHRKMVIIDEKSVYLGSANLTAPSLMMHRNLIIGLSDKKLAAFLLEGSEKVYEDAFYLLPNKAAITPLVETLDGAKKSLEIAMFTFTHPELIEAVCKAHLRGVKVVVHLSKNHSRKAEKAFEEAGICMKYPLENVLCHHKWALIDKEILIFGSANWTKSAFTRNEDYFYIMPIPKYLTTKLKP